MVFWETHFFPLNWFSLCFLTEPEVYANTFHAVCAGNFRAAWARTAQRMPSRELFWGMRALCAGARGVWLLPKFPGIQEVWGHSPAKIVVGGRLA
jgi:hypothetical protein